jgi:hypothetical protein
VQLDHTQEELREVRTRTTTREKELEQVGGGSRGRRGSGRGGQAFRDRVQRGWQQGDKGAALALEGCIPM